MMASPFCFAAPRGGYEPVVRTRSKGETQGETSHSQLPGCGSPGPLQVSDRQSVERSIHVGRGLLGTIISVLVIIVLVILIMQLV